MHDPGIKIMDIIYEKRASSGERKGCTTSPMQLRHMSSEHHNSRPALESRNTGESYKGNNPAKAKHFSNPLFQWEKVSLCLIPTMKPWGLKVLYLDWMVPTTYKYWSELRDQLGSLMLLPCTHKPCDMGTSSQHLTKLVEASTCNTNSSY